MKSQRIAVLALATVGLIGTSALADSPAAPQNSANHSQNSAQSNTQNNRSSQKAPEGYVLFREDVVWMTANEPQNHFIRAQALLDENKPRIAAGELRTAAAYLDMQASRGPSNQDQKLTQAADQLRQDAKQLSRQQGNPQANAQNNQRQQFKQDFAQANLALADHLQTVAKNELQNNKKVLAGHDLVAAADSLGAACAWDNQQPSQQAKDSISEAQRAADQLLNGSEFQENSAQTAGAKMGQNNNQNQQPTDPSSAIDNLGNAIQSIHLNQSSQQGGQSSK